jgi:hypothetical protein
VTWLVWIFLALFPLMVACGGGGDDDDSDSSDGSDENSAAQDGRDDDGDDSDSDNDNGDDSDAGIPDIEAAFYGSGEVHIQVTGDKDFEIDAEGNGIAQEGFALFTYQNADASIQIAFSSASGEPPGGVSVTARDLATAAEWGRDCQFTFDQSDDEATGEFTCDEIDALVPGSTESVTVKITGTFKARR